MPTRITDQVIDFYQALFQRIFSEPFQGRIQERLRRNAVTRQIEEAADAASQSLTRFFLNQQLSEPQAADILAGLAALSDLLKLEDIANPNKTPESVVDELLVRLPVPPTVQQVEQAAVYRIVLHSIIRLPT